jgi:hypothetical protein
MMKRTFLSLTFLLLAGTLLLGQEIGEQDQPMALGSHNAIFVDLKDASSSFTEKAWRDFVGQYGKAKKVKKGDEWLVEGAQIIDIGGVNAVNLYSRTDETAGGSRHFIWIESGGSFVSRSDNPDAYSGAKRLLEDFAHKIKVDLIMLDLDSQQKAMDNLEKELSKLKKDNESYHKTIEDAKERIAKAESDIVKNVQDQQLRMQEIELQRKVVEEVREKLEKARNEKS